MRNNYLGEGSKTQSCCNKKAKNNLSGPVEWVGPDLDGGRSEANQASMSTLLTYGLLGIGVGSAGYYLLNKKKK